MTYMPPPTPAPGAMTVAQTLRALEPPRSRESIEAERVAYEEMLEYSRESVVKAGYDIGDGPSDAPPIIIGPPDPPPTYTPGAPQPGVIGGAHQVWQSNLAEIWPYIRANGLPGESEILPGRNAPLNDSERDYFQQMIDKGAP